MRWLLCFLEKGTSIYIRRFVYKKIYEVIIVLSEIYKSLPDLGITNAIGMIGRLASNTTDTDKTTSCKRPTFKKSASELDDVILFNKIHKLITVEYNDASSQKKHFIEKLVSVLVVNHTVGTKNFIHDYLYLHKLQVLLFRLLSLIKNDFTSQEKRRFEFNLNKTFSTYIHEKKYLIEINETVITKNEDKTHHARSLEARLAELKKEFEDTANISLLPPTDTYASTTESDKIPFLDNIRDIYNNETLNEKDLLSTLNNIEKEINPRVKSVRIDTKEICNKKDFYTKFNLDINILMIEKNIVKCALYNLKLKKSTKDSANSLVYEINVLLEKIQYLKEDNIDKETHIETNTLTEMEKHNLQEILNEIDLIITDISEIESTLKTKYQQNIHDQETGADLDETKLREWADIIYFINNSLLYLPTLDDFFQELPCDILYSHKDVYDLLNKIFSLTFSPEQKQILSNSICDSPNNRNGELCIFTTLCANDSLARLQVALRTQTPDERYTIILLNKYAKNCPKSNITLDLFFSDIDKIRASSKTIKDLDLHINIQCAQYISKILHAHLINNCSTTEASILSTEDIDTAFAILDRCNTDSSERLRSYTEMVKTYDAQRIKATKADMLNDELSDKNTELQLKNQQIETLTKQLSVNSMANAEHIKRQSTVIEADLRKELLAEKKLSKSLQEKLSTANNPARIFAADKGKKATTSAPLRQTNITRTGKRR